MLLLDTCALIFDALAPHRLSRKGAAAIKKGTDARALCCCDISFWEVAMLVSKGRLEPGVPIGRFLHLAIQARSLQVLPLTPEIAEVSVSLTRHKDPADRIIGATSIVHDLALVTSDRRLRSDPRIETVW